MVLDLYSPHSWLGSLDSDNPWNETFLTHESIVEVMSLEETSWNNIHLRSLFLPSVGAVPTCLNTLFSLAMTTPFQKPILDNEVLSEGKLGNILKPCPSRAL